MKSRLLLLVFACLLSLTACASSTATATLTPSTHPSSKAPAIPVSISLSANTAKVGSSLTINGEGFNPSAATEVNIVQGSPPNLKILSLVTTPVALHSDGTFTESVTIPSGLTPGPAYIKACSLASLSGITQCARQDITLT